MASKKKPNKKDQLAKHGMTPEEQHAATMRASAVPASDFEGEYMRIGTYNSPAARLVARKAWESRMRKEMGSFAVFIEGNEDTDGI